MKSRILVILLVIILLLIPVGMAVASGQMFVEEEKPYRVGMIVNIISGYDPFNSLVLRGLFLVRLDEGYEAVLSVARTTTDFDERFETTAQKSDLILSAGYDLISALMNSSALHPEKKYLTVDLAIDESELPKNMADVIFRSQEPSYIAGYIAGMMTETNKVGILEGINSEIIDQFYYAFLAGIETASQERGEQILLVNKVVGSYQDPNTGKIQTLEMYDDGADIVFVVAGESGNGGIEAATERGKYVIGVDTDQNYLAPQNVIFSVTKKIDTVIYDLVTDYRNGTDYGGRIYSVGYAEGGVDVEGFIPAVPVELIEKAEELKQAILNGTLVVPNSHKTYDAWSQEYLQTPAVVNPGRH